MTSFTDRVLTAVRSVPSGQVASYGLIGAMAGSPRAAQAVGQVLHHYGDKPGVADLPWWRIINRQGFITTPCLEHPAQLQAALLKNEGVVVIEKKGLFWVNPREFSWEGK